MSDTSPFGFGRFVPGFDFLQNLAKNASDSSSKIPGLSNWIAPTMSVDDIEKRVDELKAVQFWLEQNSRALTATIQALEVQKMTLSTLKSMNVSMGDMGALFQPKAGSEAAGAAGAKPGDAFAGVTQAMTDAMVRATSAFAAPMAKGAQGSKGGDKEAAPAPAPAPEASQAQTQAQATGPVVDPMQWWGSLTQQIQQIANNTLQDVTQKASLEKAASMTQDAFKSATDMASQIAATGMKNVSGTGTGTGKAKAESAKKKPEAAPSAGKDQNVAAGDDAPAAAKKEPARRAAAPTKRARG